MAHVIDFNRATGIIETRLTGVVKGDEIVEIMKKAAELSRAHQCFLWLNDFSEATTDISESDAAYFPMAIEYITTVLGPDKMKVKRAIVTNIINPEHLLAEIVSSNNRQALRAFSSINQARMWLNGTLEEGR